MGVFVMPSLGADMEDGTLTDWMVAIGDSVSRGDIVAVVETQKGAIEIECFEAGPVTDLIAREGDVVPVGAPLAVIGAPEASDPNPTEITAPPADPPPEPVAPRPQDPPVPSVPEAREHTSVEIPNVSMNDAKPEQIPRSSEGPKASPAARMRARDLGVDLTRISGTGPGGVIVIADVEHALEDATPAHPLQRQKDAMRQAIAAAMVRSKQTIPHFYLSHTTDAQPAIDHVARLNADRPPSERILLGAVFLRATALAARDCPDLNRHDNGEGFVRADAVNVGLAIALRGGGLVAPAVLGADELSLTETMAAMRDLVARARTSRLRSREMTAGTITLSSLGESGADAMAGVIFAPQVAMVGLGAPHTRPWVVDGTVQPRTVVTMTLSVDHRANDGRNGSQFIAAFETHLNRPDTL